MPKSGRAHKKGFQYIFGNFSNVGTIPTAPGVCLVDEKYEKAHVTMCQDFSASLNLQVV